ncbi:RICIN domain-containing protein [Microbacterium gilvum]|uniref:F5/8 type C domain-containing protein n=1 Tax=Microbacterium gilvum TaxID=1336204 RepID=A0ABP9AI37_9MICO
MRTRTRRALHAALAATVVALATLAATAPSTAEATAPPDPQTDLLGAGQAILIESVHAVGKVVELGAADAQPTTPDDAPAAAAVFTRATTPEALREQAIAAYPVAGADETFVLAAADGRVLVRRDNADPSWRYLELIDVPLADAAVDSSAQWRFVDAGDGTTAIQNVRLDASGGTAALDMYNWSTADGSEVQTYTASGAAVQRWRVQTLVPVVAETTGTVAIGTPPALPAKLTAVYDWGLRHALTGIAWTQPEPDVWHAEGTVVVEGTATGWFGETVPLTARYVVGALADGIEVPLAGYAGMTVQELRMSAPRTVDRAVSGSDAVVTADVAWDWSAVDDAALAAAGTVRIPAADATGFSATLVVTLTEPAQENILRGEGVHHVETYNSGTFALTDGDRDRTGFSDWRSGGAGNRVNPNSVSFYLDAPRRVTGAAVYDIGGTKNIGQVTVQYRDLIGGWIDLPVEGDWPSTATGGDLALEVTSAPVTATAIRVVFSNASTASWMTLSEIEVYGPTVEGAL